MKSGILMTPGAHAAAQVMKAESYGFDSAFFIDSPMIFGDPYISMAVAAVQTRRIMLATGVTNPLIRLAPITAASVASLNAIAPGRIALGIGVGMTANLAMGRRRNATLAELERYVSAVRQLLRGEVSEIDLGGEDAFVKFFNTEGPWVNISDRIPIYVAAAGPRSLEMAGRIADAIILGGIANLDIIDACRQFIAAGAKRAGRSIDQIEIAVTPSLYVTEDEPVFEDVREVLGPKTLPPAMLFSRIAELSDTVPRSLTEQLVRVREQAYRPETDEGEDPRRRHLKAYGGYWTRLREWQYPLVTKEVLESLNIVGTVEQCIARIRRLREHKIDHIILSPLPQHVESTIEVYGKRILPGLKS